MSKTCKRCGKTKHQHIRRFDTLLGCPQAREHWQTYQGKVKR